MKFLDEILREYAGGKIDISSRVLKRMAAQHNNQTRVSADEGSIIERQANINNFFQVELTGFLSDMLVLFSDFDD